PATTSPSRASAMLTPHSGVPNRKLVVPSSGSTIQLCASSLPPVVPPSSPMIETRSAGPDLVRATSSPSWPKRCSRPSPATWAALIIALSSGEARNMVSVPATCAPQAQRQQHGKHGRADPEADRRAEVVVAHAIDHGHAVLDQRAGHLLLHAGADVAADA